ncbi:MAG: hypothetical protein J6V54_10755 [Bacteroidales bacterium]|nr:hypothetical protein [Bacteroidales bacterium]
MKTKQTYNTKHASGNGLQRTCSRSMLATFLDCYKKSNANCDYRGEVEVFWTDKSKRVQLRTFYETYLRDMMQTGSEAKSGYYEFKATDAALFKKYLDAAKAINLSAVPTFSTVPEGEHYYANEYWQIPVPFSQEEQQKVLDGVHTDLLIQQEKEQTATAMQQAAQAELEAYRTEQELKSEKANNNKWIIVAGLALILIIILKRTKQR